MSITIAVDQGQFNDLKDTLRNVRGGANLALVRAANKTATTVRSRVVKRVYAELNLTQKAIRTYTFIKRANYDTLASKVVLEGERIPLIKYNPIQLKMGVRVTIRRGNIERLPGLFITEVGPQNYRGAFLRGGATSFRRKPAPRRVEASNLWGSTVLPVDDQHGPSVPMVFHHNGEREVFDEGMLVFQKNLTHEVEFLLSKL